MSKCVIFPVLVEDGQDNGHIDMCRHNHVVSSCQCLLSVQFVLRWLFSQSSQ